MAKTAIAVTGRTAAEFETNFNAALASVLTERIDIASFTVTETLRREGVEYRALVITDDALAATITEPYKAKVFQSVDVSQLASDIQDWYTANPTAYAAPPVMSEGMQTRNLEQTFAILVYNDDDDDGQANWSGGTGGNVGQVQGDLAGTFPQPTVEQIQGRSIDNTAQASGDILMFSGSGIQWTAEALAFATGAAAAAAAPLVNGRRIIITTGGDAGIWQVNTNGGATFPGDYTQLSTSITLAQDWNVNDADGLFQGTDGETVCRELVAPPTRVINATPDTLVSEDHVLAVDLATIAAATTVRLPASPTSDERHVVCDATGDANAFTITVNGNGNTINGESTYLINFPYGSATFQWDSTNGEWRVLAGYLEQPRTKLRASLQASALDSPQNTDWAVNNLAGLSGDDNNAALDVRYFDDTDEEGVGFKFEVPVGATQMTLTLWSRARTSPGGGAGVAPVLYHRRFADNAAPTAWSAGTPMPTVTLPSNEHFQKDSQTFDLSTLGVAADTITQFELTRQPGDASDTLTGDWALLLLVVEFA